MGELKPLDEMSTEEKVEAFMRWEADCKRRRLATNEILGAVLDEDKARTGEAVGYIAKRLLDVLDEFIPSACSEFFSDAVHEEVDSILDDLIYVVREKAGGDTDGKDTVQGMSSDPQSG